MTFGLFFRRTISTFFFWASVATADGAQAASCGKTAAGFETWKRGFATEAARRGVGSKALAAFATVHYVVKTIQYDRTQPNFKLSLNQYLAKRGGAALTSAGRGHKRSNAALFARIKARYGVPPGPLIAIWGLESRFGSRIGSTHILSSVATLAYDCRRSAYFTTQLYAALKLIDKSRLSGGAMGSLHGEIGQTQFLPANVLKYGVDGDGDGRVDLARSKADILFSTANYLKAKGWRTGAGYQPGEPNFQVIQRWNAARVYQQAIASIAADVDRD
jgi:lytic murein transglycosylase